MYEIKLNLLCPDDETTRVDVEINLSESTTRFDNFTGYSFDDQIKQFKSYSLNAKYKKKKYSFKINIG